jgi:hypothetical protein
MFIINLNLRKHHSTDILSSPLLFFCLLPTNLFRVDCPIPEFTLPTHHLVPPTTLPHILSLRRHHHRQQLIPTLVHHAPTTRRQLNVAALVDPVVMLMKAPSLPEADQVATHTLHQEPDHTAVVTALSASKRCYS